MKEHSLRHKVKKIVFFLFIACTSNFAFAQLTGLPKDSVKTANQCSVFTSLLRF